MGQGFRSPRPQVDRRRPTESVPTRSCSEEQPNSERGMPRLRSWSRLSGSRPWRGPGTACTRPTFGAATTSVSAATKTRDDGPRFVGPDAQDPRGRPRFGGAGQEGPETMGPLRWDRTLRAREDGSASAGTTTTDLRRRPRYRWDRTLRALEDGFASAGLDSTDLRP